MNVQTQNTTDEMAGLPLKGIRVVELCHVIMGPTVGLVLSELGADVIKIEPLPEGDRTRTLRGHIAGSFGYYNRNKRSIGIDIKSPAGKDVLRRLIKRADIVTENFAPGTADRIGIGYDDLSAINERIIYCSLKGFLPGPYEKRAGLDELAQFMSGLAYMTGPPGQPLRAGSSIIDVGGALFGVIGILAALHQRERTGFGQKIESALFETSAFFVGQHMAGETVTGKESMPYPVRKRSWAIYEVFQSRDEKDLFIGITSDKQWVQFCHAFGRTDLMRSEWSTNEQRRDAHDVIKPLVADIFRSYTGEELIEMLTPLGCPVGLAARPRDLFEDPQLNFEDRMSTTTLANGKTVKLPRLPILMSSMTGAERPGGAVPDFAAHTDLVLAELGYSEAETAEMRRDAAIE